MLVNKKQRCERFLFWWRGEHCASNTEGSTPPQQNLDPHPPPIQTTRFISLRSILMFRSHIVLLLRSGQFPTCWLTEILCAFFFPNPSFTSGSRNLHFIILKTQSYLHLYEPEFIIPDRVCTYSKYEISLKPFDSFQNKYTEKNTQCTAISHAFYKPNTIMKLKGFSKCELQK